MATRNTNIASKAAAYGIPGVRVDGNDVLAVWQAAGEAVRRARAGEGPTLIESLTYRQVGPPGRRPGHRLVSHAGGVGLVDEALPDRRISAAGCWNRATPRRPT